jgi:hypothetical protein
MKKGERLAPELELMHFILSFSYSFAEEEESHQHHYQEQHEK